tara:strand:- start:16873 stop:17676 length:804 start_codon:yes stop_codon:yes gene_type:complete
MIEIGMSQTCITVNALKKLNVPQSILQKMDEILMFKIFKDLPLDDIALLLKSAHVHKFESGKQLLTVEEDPLYLYALFSGEAKVFCSSKDGREAVVSVVTKGESMLENTIMFNRPSMVSCTVLSAGEFLAIPADVVRRAVQKSHALSVNFLEVLANQNSQLIFQFEEITLQTAVHRVGSYLLRTKIDQGAQGVEFNLDCEKSLIASYLGMTPETLSRALSKLRLDGVDVQKRHVKMETPHSLCDYHHTAYDFNCPHWQTKRCPKFFG